MRYVDSLGDPIARWASAKIDYGKESRDTFSLGDQSLRWTSWVFLLLGILEKLGFLLR